MKKIILTTAILVNFAFTFRYSDYCDGYREGWVKGYCYEQYACSAPYPPSCPYRNPNEKDTYKDGFMRGFKDGVMSNR